MINYNDYPTLTNEQYQELDTRYKEQDTNSKQRIFESIQFTINSLYQIKEDCNQTLSNCLSNNLKELQSIQETLRILYPQISCSNQKFCNNIFLCINSLIDLSESMQQQSKTSNLFYSNNLSKLSQKTTSIVVSIIDTLSKLDIKFYKFM